MPSSTIDAIARIASTPVWRTGQQRKAAREDDDDPTWWIPLGFHPLLVKAVNKSIYKINHNTSLRILMACIGCGWDHVRARVAWKNAIPSMLQRVIKTNEHEGKIDIGGR